MTLGGGLSTALGMTAGELAAQLDERGYAVVPRLLDEATARELTAVYDDEPLFRSTIVMQRHGYGRGEYRYFKYPLPPLIGALREALYTALVPTANAWSEQLGSKVRFPTALPLMLELCAEAGQLRPTALLLRYHSGDYNALHQDIYGEVAFPLQATVLLSDPATFSGGEFVLVEAKPRKQSVAHVVPLGLGDCIIFPNRLRPNAEGGRSTFRHGVAEVRGGTRVTLGVILHDAQ
jgi:uncharacterized protein